MYWFRTPPGVRVGRSPLDEDAIRSIEESNPELKFDWKRILQARPEPAPVDPRRGDGPRRRQRNRNQDRRGAPASGRRTDARPPRPPRAPEPAEPVMEPVETAPAEDAVEQQVIEAAVPAILEVDARRSDVRGPELEEVEEEDVEEGERDEPARVPAARTLDPESHARLRARYAEILARISERTTDPSQLEELRTKAARLDPDAWVTADEVRDGLEHYEQVYAELRLGLGRRRRRRRGRSRPGGSGRSGGSSGSGGAGASGG